MTRSFQAGFGADTAGFGPDTPGAGLRSPAEVPIHVLATFHGMDLLLRGFDMLGPESQRVVSFLLRKFLVYVSNLCEFSTQFC